MTTVVNVFEDDEDELLRSILRTVRRIEQKLDTYIRLDLTGDEAMALDIQALLDSASAISDVTEATQVALGQLAQELRDAAGDQEKVNAVADQLEANALAIGAAIASTDDVRDVPPAEVPTEPTPEVPSEPVPEPSPEPQPEPEVPSEPDPAPEPEPTPEGDAPVEEPPAGGIGGA